MSTAEAVQKARTDFANEGGKFPAKPQTVYDENPEAWKQLGYTDQESYEHAANAKAQNLKAVQDAHNANQGLLDGILDNQHEADKQTALETQQAAQAAEDAKPPIPRPEIRPLSDIETRQATGISKILQKNGVSPDAADAFARQHIRDGGTPKDALSAFNEAGGIAKQDQIKTAIQTAEGLNGKTVDELTQQANATWEKANPGKTLSDDDKAKLSQGINALAPAISRWKKAFAGLNILAPEYKSAGVSFDPESHTLDLSIGDLLHPGAVEDLIQHPDRPEKVLSEEAIHALTTKSLSDMADEEGLGRNHADIAAEIWNGIPDQLKSDIEKSYTGGTKQNLTDRQLGHEFLRMVMQREISLNKDGVTKKGTILSEETLPQRVIARVRDCIRRVLSYLPKLSENLAKEGADAKTISLIEEATKRTKDAITSMRATVDSERQQEYENAYADANSRTEGQGGLSEVSDQLPGEALVQAAGAGEASAGSESGVTSGTGQEGSIGSQTVQSDDTISDGSLVQGGTGQAGSEQTSELEKKVSALEAEKAEREAAQQRAEDRRNSVVLKKAANTADKDNILASVPDDAKEQAKAVLDQMHMGDPTYVLGTNREKLPAAYVASPPPEASHIGQDFQINPNYGGKNTREYHSNPAEKEKVLSQIAPGQLDPDSYVSDVKSAAAGPQQTALVIFNDAEGHRQVRLQTAGGNGRQMIRNLSPIEDQERLQDAWKANEGRFGLTGMPEGWEGSRFLGVYDLRDPEQAANYQQLVDKLNPNEGMVADVGARAEIDASHNIPIERLVKLPLNMSGERAKQEIVNLLKDSKKLGLDRNLMAGYAKNPKTAQDYMQRLVLASAFRSKGLNEFYASTQTDMNHVTVASLIKDSTPVGLKLREKGHGNLSDAIGHTLERIIEYLKNGDRIGLAIKKAAEQAEMGPEGSAVNALASALERKIEYHPLNKRGIKPVDSEETIQGFQDLMRDISTALDHHSDEPDMFGEAPSPVDALKKAIDAHFRKVESDNNQPPNTGSLQSKATVTEPAKRIRQLMQKQREEGLNRYENEELINLEKRSGQHFMDFFEQTKKDDFALEQEAEKQGLPKAPADQLKLLSRRTAERERDDDSQLDLFSPEPEDVQKYSDDLEKEGITDPVVKAKAAMEDFGITPKEAIDLFHNPINTEPITDFGEKIAGAKKDLWKQNMDAIRATLPEDVKQITISKNFPEPDYEKLIEQGADKDRVAAMKAVRDMIPRKPQAGYKLRRWGELVKTLHDVLNKIVSPESEISNERLDEILSKSDAVKKSVDLYRDLGFPACLHAKDWKLETWNGPFMWNSKRYKAGESVTFAEHKGRMTDLSSENPDQREAAKEVAAKIKGKIEESQLSESEKPDQPRETKFNVYHDHREGGYFIGKKGLTSVLRVKSGFASSKDAFSYINDNRKEVEGRWQEMKWQPTGRKEINDPRVGKTLRTGDVTPDQFSESFGFRGVQFGNYVEDERRQQDLNHSYDGLMDLSEALGVPPKALSLDGALGLAFGARGSGKALAHYEPEDVAINLTKGGGPGSLAHEWFHALDHYFSKFEQTGTTDWNRGSRGYATEATSPPNNVRPEVWDAFKQVRKALENNSFADRSKDIDETRSKPYYGTTIEKAARAFESYVKDRLANTGIANDYLANITEGGPYPTKTEMRNGIRQAFDHLFETLDTKTTDKGTQLFSKRVPANEENGIPPSTEDDKTPKDPNEHPSENTAIGDEAQRAIQRLNEGLERESTARKNPKSPLAVPDRVSPATSDQLHRLENSGTYQLADKIAGIFGKKIVLYNPESGYTGNGIVNTSHALRDYIFLRAENQRPHLLTLGHELWHRLSVDSPELAESARRILRPMVRDWIKLNNEHSSYPPLQRLDESIGDFLGNNIGQKEFWDKLEQKDPSVFKQISSRIKEWIDDVINKLQNWKMGENGHFSDLAKAQDVMVEVLSKYAKGDNTEISQAHLDGQKSPLQRLQDSQEIIEQAQDPKSARLAIAKASKEYDPSKGIPFEQVAKDAAGIENKSNLNAPRTAHIKGDEEPATPIDEHLKNAKEEEGGDKPYKIGTPEKAYSASMGPEGRAVDQAYQEKLDAAKEDPNNPRTQANWVAGGQKLVDMGPDEHQRIQDKALTGEALTPEETMALRIISNKKQAKAAAGDPKDVLDFFATWSSYRKSGSAASDSMNARRDLYMSPKERFRASLMDMITKPSWKVQKILDTIKDPAKAKEYLSKEMQSILDKLKQAGITPEDILKDRVALKLVDQKAIDSFRNLLSRATSSISDARKQAFDLILKNKSLDSISKTTGLNQKEIQNIKDAFIAKMRADHFQKFLTGAKADSESLLTGKEVPKEEAEKEFQKWLSKLGIVPDAEQGKPKFNIEDPAHVKRMYSAIREAKGESSLADKIYEAWINGLLSGPQTHIAIAASNFCAIAWDSTIQRGMESLINLAVKDPSAAHIGEMNRLVRSILPSISKSYSTAAKGWAAEHDFSQSTVLGTPDQLNKDQEFSRGMQHIPGKLGRVIRTPGRAVLFSDHMFTMTCGYMHAGVVAERIARAEGLKGDALEKRVNQLVQTRGDVIQDYSKKTNPSPEMVKFFAKQMAALKEGIDPEDLIADKTSDAWTLAREQAAYDAAKNDGWKPDAWEKAYDHAREVTFKQDLRSKEEGANSFEDAAKNLQDARSGNLLIGTFFPFVRIPYNMFRIGIRKSPLGGALNLATQVTKGLWAMKDGKTYINGHPDVVRDLSEQALAWGGLALLYGAIQGDKDDDKKLFLITGSPETVESKDTQGVRELNARAYGGGYVFRIGGRDGVYLPYGRTEPLVTVMGATADIVRAMKRNGTQADNMAALWNFMLGEVNSKSFLQGINSISEMLAGKNDPVSMVKKGVFQAMVPNLIRSPLRSWDDYVRDSKTASPAYDALPAGPLAEPKIDPYGEPIKKSGNPLVRLFVSTPLESDPQLHAADKLLLNWNHDNPSEAWAPSSPKSIFKGKDGKEVQMTGEEATKFRLASGRLAVNALRGIVNARNINNPTQEDVKAIRGAFEKAQTQAKAMIFTPAYIARRKA